MLLFLSKKKTCGAAQSTTTGPYGVAKLALIAMAQAYRKQYGFNAITLIPVNLYGPRDTFDPSRSHVIPSLILKCLEAKHLGKPLVVWGTGKATREFLHVADAARAIVLATEKYDSSEPVNLGTGKEIYIRDLAKIVADAVGFTGDIVFDNTKPDGQLRRCFDVSRAKREFGFESTTPIEDGIRDTVEFYLNEQSPDCRSKCTTS
jgi:GDP-L-fucose synthase